MRGLWSVKLIKGGFAGKYFLTEKEGQVLKLFKKSKYGDTVVWFYKLWGRNKIGNHAFIRRI